MALLFKTRAAISDAVIQRIEALHEYDTPCIVCWPVDRGSAPYLQWITQETTAIAV